MSPNFNSQVVGELSSRVMSIFVNYVSASTADITVNVQDHVMLANGGYISVGNPETFNFSLTPEQIATGSVPLRHPTTGVLLGVSMPLAQVFTGVASVVRQAQIDHMTPAPAPAPEVTE